jgi:hypothetical protein
VINPNQKMIFYLHNPTNIGLIELMFHLEKAIRFTGSVARVFDDPNDYSIIQISDPFYYSDPLILVALDLLNQAYDHNRPFSFKVILHYHDGKTFELRISNPHIPYTTFDSFSPINIAVPAQD